MKALRFAFLAALLGADPASAAQVGDVVGTWECRQAGVEYHNKPPILYVADTGGAQSQVTIEVDGFAREIYGRSEISSDQDGWWKVKPAQGQEFMLRPESGAKLRTPAMGLRFADSKGDYRCLRLPLTSVPDAAPPLLHQGVAPAEGQNVPPSGESSAPPSGGPGVQPTDMPTEGAPPKKE